MQHFKRRSFMCCGALVRSRNMSHLNFFYTVEDNKALCEGAPTWVKIRVKVKVIFFSKLENFCWTLCNPYVKFSWKLNATLSGNLENGLIGFPGSSWDPIHHSSSSWLVSSLASALQADIVSMCFRYNRNTYILTSGLIHKYTVTLFQQVKIPV